MKSKTFPYFIAIAIDAIGFTLIGPVLVPLINQIISSSALSQHFLYGLILSLYSLGFMFGAPILGALSDIWGRKRILIIASVGVLIGYGCYLVTLPLASLSLLILGRVITGFFAASQCTAQAAMADISQATQKINNIALIAAAMTMGLVLGPLAGVFLSNQSLDLLALSKPIYIIIAVLVLNLICIMYFLKETHRPSVLQKEIKHFNQQMHHFFNLFKNKAIFTLFAIFFLFELGWSLYYQSLAIDLPLNLKLEPRDLGFFLSFIGICLSVALIGLVRLLPIHIDLSKTLRYVFAIGSLALIAQFFLSSLLWHYVLAVIITGAVAIGYSGLITLASHQTHKDQQGLLMGTSDSLLALAFTITGLLAGFLSYLGAGLSLLVAAACWVAALLYVIKKKQKTQPLNAAIGR